MYIMTLALEDNASTGSGIELGLQHDVETAH